MAYFNWPDAKLLTRLTTCDSRSKGQKTRASHAFSYLSYSDFRRLRLSNLVQHIFLDFSLDVKIDLATVCVWDIGLDAHNGSPCAQT